MGQDVEKELEAYREQLSNHYIQFVAFDSIYLKQANTLSGFIRVSNIKNGLVFTGEMGEATFKYSPYPFLHKIRWVSNFASNPWYGREKLELNGDRFKAYDVDEAIEDAIEQVQEDLKVELDDDWDETEREEIIRAHKSAISKLEALCFDDDTCKRQAFIEIHEIYTELTGDWGEVDFGRIVPQEVLYYAAAAERIIAQHDAIYGGN